MSPGTLFFDFSEGQVIHETIHCFRHTINSLARRILKFPGRSRRPQTRKPYVLSSALRFSDSTEHPMLFFRPGPSKNKAPIGGGYGLEILRKGKGPFCPWSHPSILEQHQTRHFYFGPEGTKQHQTLHRA